MNKQIEPSEGDRSALSIEQRQMLKVESLLGEAHAQAALALHAAEFLMAPPPEGTTEDRWTMFSAFLTHAAAVSRILHPPNGAVKAGRRALVVREKVRETIRAEALPLLSNRDVRDSVEHVDERIERWADGPDPLGPLDWAWVPAFTVNVAAPLKAARLRTFEQHAMVMLNRDGDDVDVLLWQELIGELKAVAVRTWNWRPAGGPTIPVEGERSTTDEIAGQYGVEL